ncbi:MAG: hypothetical protein WA948_12495, partial [Pontixanthobacter sp.]
MADLHLYGGGKGGVGKSMVCRAACQHLLDRSIPFNLYESDRSNPDCMRIYGKTCNCKVAIFSEGEKYDDAANKLYLSAIKQRTLVNLPAQVQPALKRWLHENDILSLAAEDNVRFIHWFVSNGSYDSLSLFQKYVVQFPTMKHLFIKNQGVAMDWSGFEEDEELLAFIAERKIPVLDFPRFHGAATRNRIDADSLTFGKARDRKLSFSSIDRRRVKTFMEKASA